jgi:hypothetical protein
MLEDIVNVATATDTAATYAANARSALSDAQIVRAAFESSKATVADLGKLQAALKNLSLHKSYAPEVSSCHKALDVAAASATAALDSASTATTPDAAINTTKLHNDTKAAVAAVARLKAKIAKAPLEQAATPDEAQLGAVKNLLFDAEATLRATPSACKRENCMGKNCFCQSTRTLPDALPHFHKFRRHRGQYFIITAFRAHVDSMLWAPDDDNS